MKRLLLGIFVSIGLGCASSVLAHVGNHPSVHDTVAGVVERLRRARNPAELRALTLSQVQGFLTTEERETLGSEHLSFRVNVPVTVSVIRYVKSGEEPFWLKDRGFRPTTLRVKVGEDVEFDVWQKEFPAGWVGLGVNSLTGGGRHYFVAVAATNAAVKPEISQLYPGSLRLETLAVGELPYLDDDETIKSVPDELRGQTLVQTENGRRDAARLVNLFRVTEHPGSGRPDQIILTWAGDPRRTQSIQWRTNGKVKRGFVTFQEKATFNRFQPASFKRVKAETARWKNPTIANDPEMHWHTVNLTGLEPDTTYVYSVGDGTKDGWTELAEFTTAPDGVKPFSFVYMGDAQNGLDRWGTLVQNAFRQRPDAAFYIMAGDLVNRGAERDDWDSLFYNARGVYDRRQLVPVIGNHECQGGHPTLYLKYFNLPKDGPPGVEAERAYAFDYSNARFIVLDSNLPPDCQTQWLEEQLTGTKATWKFVTYHHPAYSSGPKRDNKKLREAWTPLFDKYHVDLALQGHDHAYLRTYPMKGEKRAASPKEGTVYVVSVSGTKMYAQDKRDYTEFGMTNVATYQVLDIQISGNRLVYRAYDIDGKLRDDLVIEK
ncbi:MAG TPA: metallophosphoesterase family protein [Verrucomicrobiae bacterium]|nr:metallophosphoesterase family protein [Verrucomicrobiae bacterium]